jgi:hypothetical protein
MKRPSLVAFLVLAGLAPVSLCQAQVLLSLSGSAPTTNIIAQAQSTAVNLAWRGDTFANQRNVGQTFTPTANTTLSAFTMEIFGVQSAAPGAAFTLALSTYPNAASGIPTATLATWTGTLPTTGMAANTYLTFDLPDTALTAGTVYGIMLTFTDLAANRILNFYQGGGGIYANGSAIFYAPTTNTYTAQNDFTFYAQSVPEPSAFAYLGLATAGLVIWKSRRRFIQA